jgi:hypothetical protein
MDYGNTSGMSRHLKRYHPTIWNTFQLGNIADQGPSYDGDYDEDEDGVKGSIPFVSSLPKVLASSSCRFNYGYL